MKLILIMLTILSMPAFAIEMNSQIWQTYTNKEYGFTLKYPTAVIARKKFSRAYFLGEAWSMNNTYPTNNALQHSILEIQLQHLQGKGNDGESYYYQSYVRIGVSTFPADRATCEKTPMNADPTSQFTIINNQKFYVSHFSDAGMSQYNLGTSYRQLHQGKCYSIEYVETGTNNYNTPNYPLLTQRSQALARKIINSFEFIAD